jgi:hypothetical protein
LGLLRDFGGSMVVTACIFTCCMLQLS